MGFLGVGSLGLDGFAFWLLLWLVCVFKKFDFGKWGIENVWILAGRDAEGKGDGDGEEWGKRETLYSLN